MEELSTCISSFGVINIVQKASPIFKTATDTDYTCIKKLKLHLAVKVTWVVK